MLTTQSPEWVLRNIEGHLLETEARLLHTLARGTVVELGSYRGRSTCMLGLGVLAHGGHVYAIDAHLDYRDHDAVFGADDSGAKLRNLVAAGVEDVVRIIHMRSELAVRYWAEPIDLLFIDADHSEQGCRSDFMRWSLHVKEGGRVAFHDNHYESVRKVIDEAIRAGWLDEYHANHTTVLRKTHG